MTPSLAVLIELLQFQGRRMWPTNSPVFANESLNRSHRGEDRIADESSSDACVPPKEIKNFVGHPVLLLRSKLRIHGQRENFRSDSFGNGEISLSVTKVRVGLLKV